jgi:hypothetical protein
MLLAEKPTDLGRDSRALVQTQNWTLDEKADHGTGLVRRHAAAPPPDWPDPDLLKLDEVHSIASYGRFVTAAPICGIRDDMWAKFLEERLRARLSARFDHEYGLSVLVRFEAGGVSEIRADREAACNFISDQWLIKEADDIVLGKWPRD